MLRKYASMAVLDVEQGGTRRSQQRVAHRAEFDYIPKEGMIYVRSRAISSRCNDNYDNFPAEEIKKAYRTFIGKPVFVNHRNEDHRRARGVIIDAALHEDRNPDGSPDTWAEVLMEVDGCSFPKLAKALLAGHIDRTSMGCDVQMSVCSACGNKATNPSEYCVHIPAMKGTRIYRHTANGKRRGEVIHETCYGLGFFENSLLVEEPADPTAYFLGVDARGLQSTSAKRAMTLTRFFAMRKGAPFAGYDDFEDCEEQNKDKRDSAAYCGEIKHRTEDKEARLDELEARLDLMASTLGVEGASRPAYENPADHPFFQKNPVSSENVVKKYHEATPEQEAQGKRWYSDAHLVAKAISPKDPAKGAGVLAAYSPQAAWPANLFNATRSLHEGRALGKGEGMSIMGTHQKLAQKIMGDEEHPEGLHHSKVLKSPKISDFATLIEHGDDHPDEKAQGKTRVVVDRHALSVAMGRRVNKDDLNDAPLGNRHYYEHVADQYRKAAAQLSNEKGEHIAPHQVQAVTWGVQQAQNAAEDEGTGSGKGRNTRTRNDWTRWNEHAQTAVPELGQSEPPNLHYKYQGKRRVRA